MTSTILHIQAEKMKQNWPEMQPGYTVRVHQKVQEGDKERVQIFEGLVIAVHNGHCITDRSFTVRKLVDGIGVERVFPWLSPVIAKIEVKKVAKVRRAKLHFLRGRFGKSARLVERFTNAGEFASTTSSVAQEDTPEVVAESSTEPEVVADVQSSEVAA
jgi:large subunit ribosomal protein L19